MFDAMGQLHFPLRPWSSGPRQLISRRKVRHRQLALIRLPLHPVRIVQVQPRLQVVFGLGQMADGAERESTARYPLRTRQNTVCRAATDPDDSRALVQEIAGQTVRGIIIRSVDPLKHPESM